MPVNFYPEQAVLTSIVGIEKLSGREHPTVNSTLMGFPIPNPRL